MPEFRAVQTIGDFKTLDDADMLEGYLDGCHDTGKPDSSPSRSYWHGWRNGMIEARECLPTLPIFGWHRPSII